MNYNDPNLQGLELAPGAPSPLPPFSWLAGGGATRRPPQFLGPPIMAGGGANRFVRPTPRPMPVTFGNDAIGRNAAGMPPFSWLFGGGGNQQVTPQPISPAPANIMPPIIPPGAVTGGGSNVTGAATNTGAPISPTDYLNTMPPDRAAVIAAALANPNPAPTGPPPVIPMHAWSPLNMGDLELVPGAGSNTGGFGG